MERQHRVQVLDDEVDVRAWLAQVLKEGGLTVADNSGEAFVRQAGAHLLPVVG